MESVCRELKAAELIVDELLTELDALCELTCKDGRLDNLLEKVLLNFSKTPYFEKLKQRKENLQRASQKMVKPRPQRSRKSSSESS